MKRLNLMLLIIGVSIIFFGYSKIDPLAPGLGQSDQVTTSLKSLQKGDVKTPFIGGCEFLELIDGGDTIVLPNGKTWIIGYISKWKDSSPDWRVSGISIWHINWLIEEDGITAKIWGNAELLVDGENTGDEPRGKWKLSFYGNVTPTEVGFKVVDVCVGTGKEGEVKGLVAKWNHTMNFDFNNPATFVYKFEGYYNNSKD